VEDVTVSDSCSLFSCVSLTLKVNIPAATFTKVSDTEILKRSNPKNGLWFQLSAATKKDPTVKISDILMLIELFETNLHTSDPSKDQLVEFCNKKCGAKKTGVIEAQDLTITANRKGIFETSIAVNEQCAHRSDNDYGAPHTRFYFTVKLFDKSDILSGKNLPISAAKSNLLKVVAPGKAKQTIPKKGGKSAQTTKLTVQQTLETIVKALESFDERLSNLESQVSRIDQLEQRLQATEKELPDTIRRMVTSIVSEVLLKQNEEILALCTPDPLSMLNKQFDLALEDLPNSPNFDQKQ